MFKKPHVLTEWGPLTEFARAQAAENMRKDPAVKERVESVLIKQMGEVEGRIQARKQFPESYGWRKLWLDLRDKLSSLRFV